MRPEPLFLGMFAPVMKYAHEPSPLAWHVALNLVNGLKMTRLP